MKRIVGLQLLVLLTISLLSFAICGISGFWSALAGGLSYFLPSAVAVLLLKLFKRTPLMLPKMFILGEVLKVVLSLVFMLAVFAVWHRDLAFVPFFLSLLGVSHLVFLISLRVRDYGR